MPDTRPTWGELLRIVRSIPEAELPGVIARHIERLRVARDPRER